MKLLQIASGDFFSTYGGGQVYVKNIVDEFIRQECDVTVISLVDGFAGIEKKIYHGIDLYELDHDALQELQQLVDSIHPDLIHAHSYEAQIVTIGKALSIPVVITSHHGGIVCPAGTLMNYRDEICRVPVSHTNCLRCVLRNTRTGLFWYPLMRLLSKKVYLRLGTWLRHRPFVMFVTPIGSAALTIANRQKEWDTIATDCSRMIAPSKAIAAAMVRNGLSQDKIVIIPHGIPLPDVAPPFPSVNNGSVKFFYVGRICYVKGLHILLEAFHRLRAPNAELHLIGGSGNKSEQRYETMLRHRYRQDCRIVWHGKINPTEVFPMIRNYHVSVSPSICLEIFGLNIAESLAMGKPVLATRNGGAEMQIADGVNGWLIPPNDVAAMQAQMLDIVRNSIDSDNIRVTKRVFTVRDHCLLLRKLYTEIML